MGGSNRSSSGKQMSLRLLEAMAGVLEDATQRALKSSTSCSSEAKADAELRRLPRLGWKKEKGLLLLLLLWEEEDVEDDTAIVPRRRRNVTAETFVMA